MAKNKNAKGKYKKPKASPSDSFALPDPNKPNASPVAPELPLFNNTSARWPVHEDPNADTTDFRMWFVCNYKQLQDKTKNEYFPDKLVPGQGIHRISSKSQSLAPFPPAVDFKRFSKETIDDFPVLENLILDDVEQVLMSLMTSRSIWKSKGQATPLFRPELGLSDSEQEAAKLRRQDFNEAFHDGDVESMMQCAVSFAKLLMKHDFVSPTSSYWINIIKGRAWWDQATSRPEVKKEGRHFYVLVKQSLRKEGPSTKRATRVLLEIAQAEAKVEAARHVNMEARVDELIALALDDEEEPGDPSVLVDDGGEEDGDEESEEDTGEEEEE